MHSHKRRIQHQELDLWQPSLWALSSQWQKIRTALCIQNWFSPGFGDHQGCKNTVLFHGSLLDWVSACLLKGVVIYFKTQELCCSYIYPIQDIGLGSFHSSEDFSLRYQLYFQECTVTVVRNPWCSMVRENSSAVSLGKTAAWFVGDTQHLC